MRKKEGVELCCRISGKDGNDHVRLLERFMDMSSKMQPMEYHLHFDAATITCRLIYRLLSLLLLHNNNAHSPDSTSTGNDTPAFQFSAIKIWSFFFFSQSDVTTSDQEDDVCTPDDKRRFLAALFRYPLTFVYSPICPPMILEFLTFCEIDQFKSQSLEIQDYSDSTEENLSDSQFKKLGDMIQRNVQLTELRLRIPLLQAPCAFYDSLANSKHIEVLRLDKTQWREAVLPKLIAGGDGNGVVERLLRNPQSQLQELDLTCMDLEDHHLIALAQSLPTSKVKEINFSVNNIQSRGLFEFIRQIPRMHSLNQISWHDNPWECDSHLEECGNALLYGLMENTSITDVDGLSQFPQKDLLWHHLMANYIRQKCPSRDEQPIPTGLWPRLLAGARTWPFPLRALDFLREGRYGLPSQENAVYFLLQNYPAILSSGKL